MFKKDRGAQLLEKRLDEYMEKTDKRLKRLEEWFGKSSVETVTKKCHVPVAQVSTIETIADRINFVEEKLMMEHNQSVKPLQETVAKIKRAVVDSTSKLEKLSGSNEPSAEAISSVEASFEFKLEEFKAMMKDRLDKSTADLNDSIGLSMESFHNEVENISGEVSKLTGSSVPTPLDALLSSAIGWMKALEDSMKLVEKKQVRSGIY